ncbi:5'-nucleotidase, lipoprotein e(P4) family [Haliovirga abyssi]|uniref:Lipoprotein E n=1 Tax=Haliovirga abyssi TaxID=2996794 RepID=A0AAU9D5N9_9FUSO|nr:5'-nucleotidase, lipoprotein e(P4) family [Haliovirga abyssi]BDU51386.1 lipoprotein E [Haliovirga abyssi]
MNKKLISILFIAFTVFINAEDFTEKNFENESVVAVNWVQTSGEYKALAYQAFNVAKESFLEIKKSYKGGKKLAVVVDLDETMIDNSAYAAWRILKGKGFSSSTWDEWVNSKDAKATSGAVEFSKFVNSHGGEMFYISNRSENELKDTMKNLKKLHFSKVNKDHILLKEKSSDKTKRRTEVIDNGYDIVMYVGDQLTDFSNEIYGRSNDYRNSFVDKNEYKFGKNWISIPNPTYGDFEGKGISFEYYTKMIGTATSEKEKSEMRLSRLKIWDGE